MHKLVCRAPSDQGKIFLSGTRTNSTDIFYYYTREREQEKKGHKKTSKYVLYSPFIPLQKLSEGSARSIDPLQIEAKGTISLALYTEDRTLKTAHSTT